MLAAYCTVVFTGRLGLSLRTLCMYENNCENIQATGTRGNTKGKACDRLLPNISHHLTQLAVP